MKLTDAEWSILEILWSGEEFSLKELTDALFVERKWSKNTVHTYLTRMAEKGLVNVKKGTSHPYSASVSYEECASAERKHFLSRVYGGSTSELITAFLKDGKMDGDELSRLKSLIDNMEV